MDFLDQDSNRLHRFIFKVYDQKEGRLFYPLYLNKNVHFDTTRYTILASTGVKDSSGILLFEGDMVTGIKKGPKKTHCEGVISWNSKRAGFELKNVKSKKFINGVLTSLYNIKKLGSIYDV